MNGSRILALTFLLIFAPVAHSQEPTSPHLHTVEQFVAAFNAHDSKAMAALVADDIDWLSIADQKVAVEISGKGELIKSMDAYFKSCPSCRSSLSGVVSTSVRVSAVEIASWQGKDGLKSQKSLSVYEFSDALIRRVYYFPAEK